MFPLFLIGSFGLLVFSLVAWLLLVTRSESNSNAFLHIGHKLSCKKTFGIDSQMFWPFHLFFKCDSFWSVLHLGRFWALRNILGDNYEMRISWSEYPPIILGLWSDYL